MGETQNKEDENIVLEDNFSGDEDKSIESIQKLRIEDESSLVQQLKQLFDYGHNEILNVFAQKLAYDVSKQQQIDRLHEELQRHRMDLIARTNRPIVNGLIRLHSDIGKKSENYRKKVQEELNPDLLFNSLEEIRDDIEILLDQNGITSFTEINNKFEPRRQRVVRNVETSDAQLIGTIAKRLRPGFEQGDDLIQKEQVSVYVLNESNSRQKDDAQNNVNSDMNTTTNIQSDTKEQYND